MMMRIIVCRHGETEENVKRIAQGHMPGNLTKKGIEQARELGEKLKNMKIDIIFSSDLKRAADTTKEIIKFLKDVPVFYTEKLRERDLGAFTGRSGKELQKIREDSGWPAADFDYNGGESYNMMFERIWEFIQEIKKKYDGKAVLFVTHGGPARALILKALGRSMNDFVITKSANATYNIYEVNDEFRILTKDYILTS